MRQDLSPAFSRMVMTPIAPRVQKFNRRAFRRNELALAHEKKIWLVTFTDLISLMVAFFVLMYAMSELDRGKFQLLRENFDRYLGSVAEVAPKPYLAPPLNLGNMDEIPLPRTRLQSGLDPAYLKTLIGEKTAQVPALQYLTLVEEQGQMMLTWPAGDMGALQNPVLAAALADLLATIPNDLVWNLEVPGFRAGGIESGLRQMRAVQAALMQAGYPHVWPVQVRPQTGTGERMLRLIVTAHHQTP